MLKLYTSAGTRGMRVTWALEEMSLDYELETFPFPPRSNAPEYLSINPLGTVPALVDGDVTMTESTAIIHYLASRYGPADLMVGPDEPDYATFLDFMYHADATLTFPQTVYLRFAMFEPERGLGEAGQLYADWFQARLKRVEEHLQNRDYLCADRFTTADIAVAYALYLAGRIGLGERLPERLREWLQVLMEREGYKRAVKREREAAQLMKKANEAG